MTDPAENIGGEPRPIVVLTTAPQPVDRIFTPTAMKLLQTRFTVIDLADEQDPGSALDEVLPAAFAIVGQPNLPRERLQRAAKLRVLINVEGNFYPNVDYPTCFENGIHVLGCGPAYAQAVAEYALGLAIDLARGISREDRAFRQGSERYLGAGNGDSILLRHAKIGFIGYGNLGRALHRLLVPFSPILRVYDPWLPESVLQDVDVVAGTLQETLTNSQFLFILAAVTDTNQQLLNAARLDLIPDGARVILVSRAAVIDYDALLDRVADGRMLVAIDVWPQEPLPADHRARTLDGLVLSAHRAGGIPAAFSRIGDMAVDDLTLIAAGLPPVRNQAAARELVGRYRNRPAD